MSKILKREVLFLVLFCVVGLLYVNCKEPTFTMMDMEHVVLFMQENRPFDHYFGNLRGVRGFNDRAAPNLPSGKSPFYQPISVHNIII